MYPKWLFFRFSMREVFPRNCMKTWFKLVFDTIKLENHLRKLLLKTQHRVLQIPPIFLFFMEIDHIDTGKWALMVNSFQKINSISRELSWSQIKVIGNTVWVIEWYYLLYKLTIFCTFIVILSHFLFTIVAMVSSLEVQGQMLKEKYG